MSASLSNSGAVGHPHAAAAPGSAAAIATAGGTTPATNSGSGTGSGTGSGSDRSRALAFLFSRTVKDEPGQANGDGGGTTQARTPWPPELAELLATEMFDHLLEDLCWDTVIDVHRQAHTVSWYANPQGVDIFGNPRKVADQTFECAACHRTVSVSKYAPHLEKCLNKGRFGSRASRHRRAAASVTSPRLGPTAAPSDSNERSTTPSFLGGSRTVGGYAEVSSGDGGDDDEEEDDDDEEDYDPRGNGKPGKRKKSKDQTKKKKMKTS